MRLRLYRANLEIRSSQVLLWKVNKHEVAKSFMLELRARNSVSFEDYDSAMLQKPNSPFVMFEIKIIRM